MPVMTDSNSTPAVGYDISDGPRRLVLADLVARLTVGLTGGASGYEAAAEQAEGALRHALQEIARSKHAQAADLAPLARALGVSAPPLPAPHPPGTPPSWGVILGEAFQAERILAGVARELAGLTADPAVRALATRLTAGVARDREEVLKLYLRYS